MPCNFAQFGCGLSLKKANLKDHEKTCIYRTITCLSPTCEQVHPISSYMDHLREKHANGEIKIRTENEVSQVLNLANYFRTMQRMNRIMGTRLDILFLDDHHFVLTTKLLAEGTLQFHAKILACGDQASNYRVSIRVYNAQKVQYDSIRIR